MGNSTSTGLGGSEAHDIGDMEEDRSKVGERPPEIDKGKTPRETTDQKPPHSYNIYFLFGASDVARSQLGAKLRGSGGRKSPTTVQGRLGAKPPEAKKHDVNFALRIMLVFSLAYIRYM